MTPIFLFGTLRDARLFETVTGRPLAGGRPAVLPDERAAVAADGDWPVLVPGAGADGLLVEVDDTALARLDFYEGIFGYERVDTSVETADGPAPAQLWRPAGGADQRGGPDWDLAVWREDWGAVTAMAAADMMRRFGKVPASEAARVAGIVRSRAQSRLSTAQWRRPRRIGAGLTLADVQVENRRHPYDGFFAVEEMRARFRRFDGAGDHLVDRAVFHVADAVTVLPYDPVRDRILLIEQLRFGPLAHGDPSPWLLEPIAGMIDAGETPEQTARRETIEEAGLTLGALHFIARYYPSPGGIAQVLLSYVGIADLPDSVIGTGGHPGEDEDILSHLVPFDLAVEMLEQGDMANAPLVISMQWLMARRARLRAATAA
ncbi:Tellurite resistance protein TrgB / ADP-ribose pyrophosphatase [Roseibacterium elongatum DSM 19469]|uniref:ADP-ribose pyrophosphatase n=1 Tax=Roseicyclus elongatus DSM 19469 TaxID=1294273 RepID=W8S7Z8_9RHOB|nr:NUDIX domain-containing protein [Roseibacterium elongatum]AHM05066.1 Tellurite resistance protein TrgB / ADP-ribose pyrophosphatase [Roseibacterium elongatum DSM 19469]